MIFTGISGANALYPGYFFGFFVVVWPYQVTLERTGCTENSFEFKAGQNIGVFSIPVILQRLGVVRLKTRAEDYRANIYLYFLVLHIMLDGTRKTGLFTLQTL